jgi:hypothetical protein
MHRGIETLLGDRFTTSADLTGGPFNATAGQMNCTAEQQTVDRSAKPESFAQHLRGKARKAWSRVRQAVRTAQRQFRGVRKSRNATMIAEFGPHLQMHSARSVGK